MRPELQLRAVRRSIDGHVVLDGLDLDVARGSLTTIIGPSGSGKTSLLRLVAGLDRPDSGTVVLDGDEITTRSPAARPFSMVFQHDTFFPELSVRENLALALAPRRRRGRAAARARAARDDAEAVEVMLVRMGLTGVAAHLPHQLSGGQQRRTSIARAMLLRPRVLLLDEPLSGLDDVLRSQITHQLRRLQARSGTTIVHATHDQAEALAMADQVVVMRAGRIVQRGTREQVYSRPRDAFVASLLGSSRFLDVRVLGLDRPQGARRARVEVLGTVLQVPAHDDVEVTASSALLMVRPHAASLGGARPTARVEVHGNRGIVQQVFSRGDHLEHLVETGQGEILVAGGHWPVGALVEVGLHPELTWLLPAEPTGPHASS